jgi:hypothetical protein
MEMRFFFFFYILARVRRQLELHEGGCISIYIYILEYGSQVELEEGHNPSHISTFNPVFVKIQKYIPTSDPPFIRTESERG